ncbi:MAG TPA: rod shape-determining protein MreC [Lachnospiraceae bacterium]|nr:rod shape-determining protein MreC [Lachnospiraceae bacterium]
MKKKRRLTLKNKYIFTILVFVCISLLTLTATSFTSMSPLRNVFGIVIIPMQNGLNSVGGWLSEQGSMLESKKKLAKENETLQAKIDELTADNTTLSLEKDELTRLRQLYDLDQSYSQYDKVAANVISRDSGNGYSTFVINKGSDSGIAADMNVISGSGLVGIVTNVGSNWASVRSIIDDSSNVSAMTVSHLDTCIVSGDLSLLDEGKLSFDQMNTGNEISIGEQIVTSNISDKYLEGILIGYIDQVNDDSNHLTKTGQIVPVVDFSHLQEVLVIKQLKEAGGE